MATHTFPNLYDPQDVYRDYTPRMSEFMALGDGAGLRPAEADTLKSALILIDMQNDFANKTGSLYVPGAEDDTRRLVEFIYSRAEEISSIHLTLDSHYPLQIFLSGWWENPKTHEHPAPFTVITSADIKKGVWQALVDPVWSHKYVYELERAGRHALMIWPPHTMIGSWGHNLMPALFEAVMWHSAARKTLPVFHTKGDVPQVERYGAFAPEIEYPRHPRGQTDTRVLDMMAKYNRTIWAGEAETHCVLNSQRQAVEYFGANHPDALKRMFFLMDCTSPIEHPDIDFVGMARAEQKRMAKLGVQLVKSTDTF